MSKIYLGLGTNLGDRMTNIEMAIEGLRAEIEVTAVSPVYETKAWGVEDQPDFLNLCVAGATDLDPFSLLIFVKDLEIKIGRIPSKRWGPRLIDIDILFFDDLVLNDPLLTIPHIGVPDRATILVPLSDISPNLIHPIVLIKVSELLDKVDISDVRKF